MKRISLLVCSLLVLSACTNPIKVSCGNTDWNELGFVDGLSGQSAENAFSIYVNRCENVGASANREAYLAGHQQGIKQYCTVDNGENLGRSGVALPDYCPVETAAAFESGFAKGLKDLCTPEGATQLATRLRSYQGTCGDKGEAGFLENYLARLDQLAAPAEDQRIAAQAEVAELSASIDGLAGKVAADNGGLLALRESKATAENKLQRTIAILKTTRSMNEKWAP